MQIRMEARNSEKRKRIKSLLFQRKALPTYHGPTNVFERIDGSIVACVGYPDEELEKLKKQYNPVDPDLLSKEPSRSEKIRINVGDELI